MMHNSLLGVKNGEKITSGKDAQDAYIKMLTMIKGVTEAAAKAIATEFPTFAALYAAWDALPDEQSKRNMLTGIAVSWPAGTNRPMTDAERISSRRATMQTARPRTAWLAGRSLSTCTSA